MKLFLLHKQRSSFLHQQKFGSREINECTLQPQSKRDTHSTGVLALDASHSRTGPSEMTRVCLPEAVLFPRASALQICRCFLHKSVSCIEGRIWSRQSRASDPGQQGRDVE